MKYILLLVVLVTFCLSQPTLTNDFTFHGRIFGKQEEFTLYYDSTASRMYQTKESGNVLFLCTKGQETTASFTPTLKECKVGCYKGKRCEGDECRGCFLPNVWNRLNEAKKTTKECKNSFDISGFLWETSAEGNEFCFASDDQTPVYLQNSAQGKTLRYDVKSYTSGRPAESFFEIPEYCKCPKINPFTLLNRY